MGKEKELIALVAKRWEIIEVLRCGSVNRGSLEERLDLSRSTIYRVIRQLEDEGLVEEAAGVCNITPLGRVIFDAYDEFHKRMLWICDASSLIVVPEIRTLPSELLTPDAVFPLSSTPASIEEVTEELSALVTPHGLRVLLPRPVIPLIPYLRTITEGDFVLSETTNQYLTMLDESTGVSDGATHITILPDDQFTTPPLIISPGGCTVIVVEKSGELLGFLAKDDPEVVDWANNAISDTTDQTDRPKQTEVVGVSEEGF